MRQEVTNMLRYEYYRDKLMSYHPIFIESLNIALNLEVYNLIDRDKYNTYCSFVTQNYNELLKINKNIDEVYGAIFDMLESRLENIENIKQLDSTDMKNELDKTKIDMYNKHIETYEQCFFKTESDLFKILEEQSLYKMYTTDMELLEEMEQMFNVLHNMIESILEACPPFNEDEALKAILE